MEVSQIAAAAALAGLAFTRWRRSFGDVSWQEDPMEVRVATVVTMSNLSGEEHSYRAFVDKGPVALLCDVGLSESLGLTDAGMRPLVHEVERLYDWYATITGKEPEKEGGRVYDDDDDLNTSSRLAIFALAGDSKWGACCGYLGICGIEMSRPYFEELVSEFCAAERTIAQSLPYELGRNFFHEFIKKKLQYHEPDCQETVCTGFAVFCRFASLKGTGNVSGGFRGKDHAGFESAVRGLLPALLQLPVPPPRQDQQEEEEQEKKHQEEGGLWANYFRVGQCPANELDLGVTDLFASLMFYLCDRSCRASTSRGGSAASDEEGNDGNNHDDQFLSRLFFAVKGCPDAPSTEAAAMNFVDAACAASRADDRGELRRWFKSKLQWPVRAARIEGGRRGEVEVEPP